MIEIKSWEAYASVQVVQAYQGLGISPSCIPVDWLKCAGMLYNSVDAPLVYGDALRAVEDGKVYYGVALATASGLAGINMMPVKFPSIEEANGGGIVVCPYPLSKQFHLPESVWVPVVEHLRSYGHRVSLMGEKNDRMDFCSFTEAENLSDLPLEAKLRAIAHADLVIGVPNAWTWASTSWEKKVLMFYPNGLPQKKWFPLIDDSLTSRQRWIIYEPHNLQVPIVLGALRHSLSTL